MSKWDKYLDDDCEDELTTFEKFRPRPKPESEGDGKKKPKRHPVKHSQN